MRSTRMTHHSVCMGIVQELFSHHLNPNAAILDRHMYWKKMYDTEAIKNFNIIPPQKHTRKLPTTLEGVCNRVKSKSYICVLPSKVQEQVVESIRELMTTGSDDQLGRVWIDKESGTFEYPYATGEFR